MRPSGASLMQQFELQGSLYLNFFCPNPASCLSSAQVLSELCSDSDVQTTQRKYDFLPEPRSGFKSGLLRSHFLGKSHFIVLKVRLKKGEIATNSLKIKNSFPLTELSRIVFSLKPRKFVLEEHQQRKPLNL